MEKYLLARWLSTQQKIANAPIAAKALDCPLSENPASASVATPKFQLAAMHSVAWASEKMRRKGSACLRNKTQKTSSQAREEPRGKAESASG